MAVASVALALLFTLLIRPWLQEATLSLFFGAVILSAVYGGYGPAILSIVLSVISAEVILFHASPSSASVVRVALFALVAYGAELLNRRLRAARTLAERKAAEATALAEQLQDQATELECQITESESLTDELEQVNTRLAASNEDLQQASLRNERFQQVTKGLVRTLTPGEVVVAFGAAGMRAVGADGVAVGLLDPATNQLDLVYRQGAVGDLPADPGPVPPETSLVRAVRERTAAWLADGEQQTGGQPGVGRSSGSRAILPLVSREGGLGAVAFYFSGQRDFRPEDRTFMQLLVHQCVQALERARLYEAEKTARIAAQVAERRVSLLAQASARLGASLDYGEALADIARLIVPDLADWCVIHLLDGSGVPYLLTVAHTDPERAGLLRDLVSEYPPDPSAEVGYARVLRTGAPELLTEISAATMRRAARDPEQLERLQALGLHSQVTVPIRSRNQLFGAISLIRAETARPYQSTDLALAEELAARVGQVIDNVELFETTRRASQAKSDFLAVMSHELRTPLNAIIGYADLILLGVPDTAPPHVRTQTGRIRSAAHHLLQLVDEVLSFSRVESGLETATREPVDLSALIREAMVMVEPAATEKGLELQVELPAAPIEGVSDGRKFRQIMTNLLSNAVKFTEQGHITVRLQTDSAGVTIDVTDTGIGISQESLPHIFDPFWQVEQSSTRRFGGTGLGLGVARRLARLLGGDVVVRSTLGKGSTFTVTLPLQLPETAPLPVHSVS